MKKEYKFYVIGGQYKLYNYGGAYTLEGAKRLATKNEEYWDNWQGWHKPAIYKAEDIDGLYPELGSIPYMEWDREKKKWEKCMW